MTISVIPRPAGPLDFPPPAGGGGGRLNAPPPMISAPGRRREKRKAEFESSRKIISKSFRSFFGSGQNWGHQGSKFQKFSKCFSTIKSLILMVEQRIWYYRVSNRIWYYRASNHIYNDFARSRSKFDLRSSQAKVTWWLKWVKLHISRFAWPRRTYWHQSHVSISFLIKSYWQVTVDDLGWPQMTFRGAGNANFYWNCPQLAYTIWFRPNRLAPN